MPSKSSLTLPPLLMDRIQYGHTERDKLLDSHPRPITHLITERGDMMMTPRPELHQEWKQFKASRELRQRMRRKVEEDGAVQKPSGEDDCSTMNFTEIGERIAARMKKQGVVFKSQLDITYSIEALERVWLKMDEGIEEGDFVRLLSSVLSTDPRRLSTLFQKMDANADGSIEWDEFISYLLKEATHNWDRACEEGRTYLKQAAESHETMPSIRSMVVMPSTNHGSKYAALCDDRTVHIFDSQTMSVECQVPLKEARYVVLSQFQQTADVHNAHVAACERTIRHREQFQTKARLKSYRERAISSRRMKNVDMVYESMTASTVVGNKFNTRETVPVPSAIAYHPSTSQLVVASSDKSITFFSSSFDRRHKLQFHLDGGFYLPSPPSCLDVVTVHDDEMIFVGDSHGGITVFSGSGTPSTYKYCRSANVHNRECVRKIMLMPNIGVASAGMDAEIVMTDIERWEVVRRMKGHDRGIYGLAQCPANRLLVSVGYDAKILLWDPYISTSTGTIHGHHSGVVDVVMNERHNQMITATTDRKINVYDIRMWQCIQTLMVTTNNKTQSDDDISAMIYDPYTEQLVSAGTGIQTWQVVSDQGESVHNVSQHPRAHHSLVVAIMYSTVFRQVISVSVDERVCLWDIFTGVRSFDFIATHNAPITAACLDHRGKRLLTAAQNGTVKIWNFNNGAMMHEYSKRKREISTIVYLPKALFSTVGIVAGEGIVRWADPGAQTNTTVFSRDDHAADALCLTYIDDLFVSGSRDGEIIICYAGSAIIKKRVRLPTNTDKVPGATKIKFVTVNGVAFGFIGTDDGSLHIIETRTWNILASQFKVMSEAIVGMESDDRSCRLLVCDSSGIGKIWDIQAITPRNLTTHMLMIREFTVVGTAESVTAVLYCPDVQVFAVGSDSGDILLWTSDGLPVARFGQSERWPIKNDSDQTEARLDDASRNTSITSAIREDDRQVTIERETKAPIIHRLSNPKTLQPRGLRSSRFFLAPDIEVKPPKGKTAESSENAATMLEAALSEMKALFCSPEGAFCIDRQPNNRRQRVSSTSTNRTVPVYRPQLPLIYDTESEQRAYQSTN